MFKSTLRAGLAFFALTGAVTLAQAIPLNGTFGIDIYQGDGLGDINNPEVQANAANPLITGTPVSGTYTGNLNFNVGLNTIGDFLNSGGGTNTFGAATLNSILSAGGFGFTTVFVITGDVGSSILGGTITHDDGISLYDGLGFATTLISAPFPTVAAPSVYAGLTGAWKLIYVETNSVPAVLNFDVTSVSQVPLPGALPLFATGLGALGLLGWRRKRKDAAAKVA